MEPQRLQRILGLALPIIGGMVSQNVLNLVDTAMGSLHLLEPDAAPRRDIASEVRVNFAEHDTLLFDGQTERLLPDAHAAVPA